MREPTEQKTLGYINCETFYNASPSQRGLAWRVCRHKNDWENASLEVIAEHERRTGTAAENARLKAEVAELADMLQAILSDTGKDGWWWGQKATDILAKYKPAAEGQGDAG